LFGDGKELLQVESVGVRITYKCGPRLGCRSLHRVYHHQGHGAICASSHGNEALVQRFSDMEEGAKVQLTSVPQYHPPPLANVWSLVKGVLGELLQMLR
jgi:hypothetical protein